MVDLKPNNNHSKLNIPIKKQTVKLNTKARYNSIGCLPETQIKYEKNERTKLLKTGMREPVSLDILKLLNSSLRIKQST